jgi:hypothetical protein
LQIKARELRFTDALLFLARQLVLQTDRPSVVMSAFAVLSDSPSFSMVFTEGEDNRGTPTAPVLSTPDVIPPAIPMRPFVRQGERKRQYRAARQQQMAELYPTVAQAEPPQEEAEPTGPGYGCSRCVSCFRGLSCASLAMASAVLSDIIEMVFVTADYIDDVTDGVDAVLADLTLGLTDDVGAT